MDTWKNLIDRAAVLCGSQNQLAVAIGSTSSNLAGAKTGQRPLTTEQIQRLAHILRMSPADVWLIAQDARNPFRSKSSRVAEGVLQMVMAVILSAARSPDALATQGRAPVSPSGDGVHIVMRWRRLVGGLRRLMPWTHPAA